MPNFYEEEQQITTLRQSSKGNYLSLDYYFPLTTSVKTFDFDTEPFVPEKEIKIDAVIFEDAITLLNINSFGDVKDKVILYGNVFYEDKPKEGMRIEVNDVSKENTFYTRTNNNGFYQITVPTRNAIYEVLAEDESRKYNTQIKAYTIPEEA